MQFLTYFGVQLKKRRKAEYLAMLLLNWSSMAFFFSIKPKAYFICRSISNFYNQHIMDVH